MPSGPENIVKILAPLGLLLQVHFLRPIHITNMQSLRFNLEIKKEQNTFWQQDYTCPQGLKT
jgi:hypothetical protein